MWTWELWHGEKFLGKLVEYGRQSMVWIHCDFTPTPEFEADYRILFDQENAIQDNDPDGEKLVEWIEFYNEHITSLNLDCLPANKATPLNKIGMLHIRGATAELRIHLTTKDGWQFRE